MPKIPAIFFGNKIGFVVLFIKWNSIICFMYPLFRSFCNRDGDIPVSFIQKYLMRKLNLQSETEVSIFLFTLLRNITFECKGSWLMCIVSYFLELTAIRKYGS